MTITIKGADDAADVTGPVTGAVVEAGELNNSNPGTPTATGDLSSSDLDNPNDAWTAVDTSTVSASGYGSYTLTAAGLWIYTLDNSNAAVEALNGRADADRHLHGADRGRHRAGGDHHHHRRQ